MIRKFWIYGLRVIGEGKFFYVGSTMNLRGRISTHVSEAMNSQIKSDKSKIILGCSAKIEMLELDSFSAEERTNELESEWIDFLRSEGHPLTNKIKVTPEKPYRIIKLTKQKTA